MQKHKSKYNLMSISIYVVILIILIAMISFRIGESIDYGLQDYFYDSLSITDPNIYIIAIDDRTLEEFGPFTDWSREKMAEAINILMSDEEYQPAVIALDILYSGKGQDEEADRSFTEAVKEAGNVILASKLTIGKSVDVDSDNAFKAAADISSYEIPFDELAEAAEYGFINAVLDSDRVIRHDLLSILYNGELEYSFSYKIASLYLGEDIELPSDPLRTYRIQYTGLPGEYYHGEGHSFCDIFSEDFDPSVYADGIVLIGSYTDGFQDSYFTPVSNKKQLYGADINLMHGIEIRANVVQMLLEGNFKLEAGLWTSIAILVFFTLLFVFIFHRLDVRIAGALVACTMILYIYICKDIYEKGTILQIFYVLLYLALCYIIHLIYNYVVEKREKHRIREIFKKYTDPKLVEKLVSSNSSDINMIGSRLDIAVMFIDIRGFTPLSEKMKDRPEDIIHMLNRYLELTSKAIFDNGGSIDKFIGDATMALFNGFIPLEDYVFCAVKAAWDMLQNAEELYYEIQDKLKVTLSFGIGIHCGEAIVGNIGPEFRKDFTAVGDTVNTAARLESNAKSSQILISEEVHNRLKDRIVSRSLGMMYLKGKGDTHVYEVVDIKG